jgi:branched-chain amino acid transport system ATP-binding protein
VTGPVLQAEGLSVDYGGVRALVDARLEVRPGQLVGLIGPNGAGKTTFVDAISGFTASRGRVLLEGVDISRMPAHTRARHGLARTWQTTELFDDLKVRENLSVACRLPGPARLLRSILSGRTVEDPGVARALELLELTAFGDQLPTSLSQGQRKLVGVARALAADPTLLCLDEPAAGLDSEESQVLGARLRDVADRGTATLLIDHDMDLVLTVCDYVYVLDFGRMIAQGPPAEVREHPEVIRAYLGRPAADPAAVAEVER